MSKTAKCPLCGKTSAAAHTPFCSQGCRDRDLLNWLGETYRVPAQGGGEEEDSALDSENDRRL